MQLKGVRVGYVGSNVSTFQFQLGAIKSLLANSKITLPAKFQFQLGAIKRNYSLSTAPMRIKFQFQLGAIKRRRSHFEFEGPQVSIPIRCN